MASGTIVDGIGVGVLGFFPLKNLTLCLAVCGGASRLK